MEKRLLRFAAVLAFVAFGLRSATVWAAPDALSPTANQTFLAENAKKPGVIVRPSGLQYRILRSGFGKRPGLGDTVQLQYSGSLINGTVFDGASPGLPVVLSVVNAMRGLSEALQFMHEGDRWQVVIPPNLAFGDKGSGTLIPPGQVVVLDVTLVSAATPSQPVLSDPQISLSARNRQQGNTREQGVILTIPQ